MVLSVIKGRFSNLNYESLLSSGANYEANVAIQASLIIH